MAREFGGWPEDYTNKPLNEVIYWVSLMSQEGEVAEMWRDMGPEDDVDDFDDEDA